MYKHALITGTVATEDIEKHFSDRKTLESLKDMDQFIFKGIKTKLNIIIKDEKESNVRKYLNLGHTFGHAVEWSCHYDWDDLSIYCGKSSSWHTI